MSHNPKHSRIDRLALALLIVFALVVLAVPVARLPYWSQYSDTGHRGCYAAAIANARRQRGFYGLLLAELRRLGHIEGKNLRVERYGKKQSLDAASLAARVRSNPDVMFVLVPFSAVSKETSRIPIVTMSGDPSSSDSRGVVNMHSISTFSASKSIALRTRLGMDADFVEPPHDCCKFRNFSSVWYLLFSRQAYGVDALS